MLVQRQSSPVRLEMLPDSPFGHSFLAALLYRLFLVAAAFSLFLPAFGPLLDHHFAEREPNHAHIYLSPATTAHFHSYEVAHSHVHQRRDVNLNQQSSSGGGPGGPDVVYLTANDGLGQTVTSLAVSTLHIDAVYSTPNDSQLLLGLGAEDGLPPESFVPPSKKPPRI